MRVVFFGTPGAAVPTLEALVASKFDVVAVVTNPDRPAGRGMKLTPSPVKRAALAAGIELLQPVRVRDAQWVAELAALRPDAAIVVAYGKILPQEVLDVPPLGFLNVHMSLLPAYRGAAPIERALMDGVSTTGVSIMMLTAGMDEGPVLARRSIDVAPDETAGDVTDRLAQIGAELLVETLAAYAKGDIGPEPQEHTAATFAPKITQDDARIRWIEDAGPIKNLVRALNPSPGAWTKLRGATVKVWRVAETESDAVLMPGQLAFAENLLVGTKDRPLQILEAQMAGKRRLPGPDLARGLRLESDESFE